MLVALFIVSCGDNSSEDTNELEGANSNSASPTNSPIINEENQTVDRWSSEHFVYVDEDKLYSIEDDDVELISENDVAHVYSAPDNTKLVYTTLTSDGYDAHITDLTTLETIQLFSMTDFPVVHNWSPDQEWVILTQRRGAPQYVINVDTKEVIQFGDIPEYSVLEGTTFLTPSESYSVESVVWLADNTLLVYEEHNSVEVKDDGGTYITVDKRMVHHVNLSNNENETLDISISQSISSIARFIEVWQYTSQVYDLIQPFELEIFPNQDPAKQMVIDDNYDWLVEIVAPTVDQITHNFPACGNWFVNKQPARASFLPEVLYQVQNILLLSDLILLPDESLLVTQWQVSNCNLSNIPTATILHIQANGDVIELAETPAIANIQLKSGRRNIEIIHNQIVDVSSDGTAIVFILNDKEADTSSIVAMDIATQEQQIIYETEGSRNITDVFWGNNE